MVRIAGVRASGTYEIAVKGFSQSDPSDSPVQARRGHLGRMGPSAAHVAARAAGVPEVVL